MILDVGCGYSSLHRRHGGIGVDRIKGKCDVVADAHKLPFANDVFHEVFLIAVLEHLENPNVCLEEVKRVSKTGAKAHITFPQVTSMPKWILRKALTDFPFGLLNAFRWLYRDKTNPLHIKNLGHKTIVTPRSVAKHLRVLSTRREGYHCWFVGRKGHLLNRLGLKDRTDRDIFRMECEIK